MKAAPTRAVLPVNSSAPCVDAAAAAAWGEEGEGEGGVRQRHHPSVCQAHATHRNHDHEQGAGQPNDAEQDLGQADVLLL